MFAPKPRNSRASIGLDTSRRTRGLRVFGVKMTKEIELTQGKVALVDDEDYERILDQAPWHANSDGYTWYARRRRRKNDDDGSPVVHMHREIIDAPEGMEVDHVNGDGLDNRRTNLRLATHAQNGRNQRGLRPDNTSGYRGVYWEGSTGKWRAAIKVDGEKIYLDLFETKEDAARAYNEAAIEHHGEFAALNELTEEQESE